MWLAQVLAYDYLEFFTGRKSYVRPHRMRKYRKAFRNRKLAVSDQDKRTRNHHSIPRKGTTPSKVRPKMVSFRSTYLACRKPNRDQLHVSIFSHVVFAAASRLGYNVSRCSSYFRLVEIISRAVAIAQRLS